MDFSQDAVVTENSSRINGRRKRRRRRHQAAAKRRRSRGSDRRTTFEAKAKADIEIETKVEVEAEAPVDRYKQLFFLTVAMVLGLTTWFSASSVLSSLRTLYAVDDTLGSLLTISVQIGFMVGAVLSSAFNLADIWPPRRVVAFGCLLAAVFNLFLLLGDQISFAVAVLFRALTGMALALVYPPLMKVGATHFTKSQRGGALGILVGGLTLGSAVPHAVNAGVASSSSSIDWRVVVGATSGLTLAGGCVVLLLARDGPFPFSRAQLDFRQIGRVFHNRGVMLASLAYIGHMVELYAYWSWVHSFFIHATAGNEASSSWFAFAAVAIGALSAWAGGVLCDRWHRCLATAGYMVASGTCAIALGLSLDGPFPLTVIIALLYGVFVIADSAQFSACVIDLSDQAYVATALTMQLASGFLISALTIWLVPVLVARFTYKYAFAFLAIGPYIGAIFMVVLSKLPESAKINNGRG